MQPNDPLGMFDRVNNGGHQDILSYLWAKYEKNLQELIDKRTSEGKATVTLERAKATSPAIHFIEWAKTFLEYNPPIENYASAGAFGVRLADGTYITVGSVENIEPGTMQESASIPVMQPRRNM